MGTYDTRGGSPLSPDINITDASPLVDTILKILEEAGLPTTVNDQIVAIIEIAEADLDEHPVPLLAQLEMAINQAMFENLEIRFAKNELSTTSGYFVKCAALDRPATKFVELVNIAKD